MFMKQVLLIKIVEDKDKLSYTCIILAKSLGTPRGFNSLIIEVFKDFWKTL